MTRKLNHSHRRNRISKRNGGKMGQRPYSLLEKRQLLCTEVSSDISADTVWSDECYEVVGSFDVESGVTLTISPGVTVSSDLNIDDIIVQGTLVANDVVFIGNNNDIRAVDNGRVEIDGGSFSGERIVYSNEARGSVSNVRFNSGLLAVAGNIALSDNTFAHENPIRINPQYASQLYNGNEFEVDAIVDIEGDVSSNAELRAIPNLSRFHVTNNVEVDSGVTLTISPNVTVTTDLNIDDFVIRGTLVANDVTFTGSNNDIRATDNGRVNFNGGSFAGERIVYASESSGSVANTRFNSGLLTVAGNVSLSNNTFGHGNPIRINPRFAAELYNGNVFEVDALVDIEGDVSSDALLRAIPNLSRFRLTNNVEIEAGVTLTVSPGVTITTDLNIDDFVVRGTLISNDVTYSGNNNDIRVEGNGQAEFNGGSFAGERIVYSSQSGGSIANTRFNSGLLTIAGDIAMSSNTFAHGNPIRINPRYAAQLYNNNLFEVDALIDIEGTVANNADLRAIPNMSRFRVTNNVEIDSGVTLRISPGVTVTTDLNIDDVVVEGNLVVNGASFSGDDNDIRARSGGAVTFSESSFAGDLIEVGSGSSFTSDCGTVDADLFVVHGGANYNVGRTSILASEVRATGSSAQTIDLRGNYWGTIDPTAIRQIITDNEDDSRLPVVDSASFLFGEPTCEAEQPEVRVTGQGQNINDNDSTPGTSDGTEFGTILEGSNPATRIFTVSNTGTADLTLSNLAVPDGFSIVEGLDGVLSPNSSDTFSVRLNSNSVGLKQGDITFETNDADEQTFNFAIEGEVAVDETRLVVQGTSESDQILIEIEETELTVTINDVPETVALDTLETVVVEGLARVDSLQVIDQRDNGSNDTDLTLSSGGFQVGTLQFLISAIEEVSINNANEGGNASIESPGRNNSITASVNAVLTTFGEANIAVSGYGVQIEEGNSEDQLTISGTTAADNVLLRPGNENVSVHHEF